jgi:ribosomal protein S18 acetylase RimI-like enzyme
MLQSFACCKALQHAKALPKIEKAGKIQCRLLGLASCSLKGSPRTYVSRYRSHSSFQPGRTFIMIVTATEMDGAQIKDITARAGVFNQEEVDCVREIWDEYVTGGPELCGYHFIVERQGDQVLGFACYGPRDLAYGVFDLYWIAVDPECRQGGVGRRLIAASEEAVYKMGGRMLIAETSGTSLYDGTRKFYTGVGYTAEATIKDFYVQGDDLVIYVKRL